MALTATPPAWLTRLEGAEITFFLHLGEDVELPPLALLQLRREFAGALPVLEARHGRETVQAVKKLLFPEPIACDPFLQRRMQKPSAAVILSPDPSVSGLLVKDERLALAALFIGEGIVAINAFLQLLQIVGERGIYRGQGRFTVDSLMLNNNPETRIRLAAESEPVTPTLVPLAWLLTCRPDQRKVMIEILTPMRLIKNGKPVFRLNCDDFFDFLLRRVSGMAAVHAGRHMDSEHQQLFEQARELECLDSSLQWRDWRHLKRGHSNQGIGGLTGAMVLSGNCLPEVLWLLELGSLLHIGKGAPYGFGRYRLVDVVDPSGNFS